MKRNIVELARCRSSIRKGLKVGQVCSLLLAMFGTGYCHAQVDAPSAVVQGAPGTEQTVSKVASGEAWGTTPGTTSGISFADALQRARANHSQTQGALTAAA